MRLKGMTKPTSVDDLELDFTPLDWLGTMLATCKYGGQGCSTTRKSQSHRD
ncbi:hypothetical protein ACUIJQ_10280 [Levilactobacillus hammesii]|uniref:Uncharacterized protein n=1 Tax=Levilactobacillus hammesii DSM 16381 TaxID=1423753 RepID=A0A0R1UN28_9LACO|nr:hypothetical protein [Levilactobacillus hammesii]KRL94556.1 hypothetical protein FD28_GL000378 [Levilactobacillus hammesii DSM 16381]